MNKILITLAILLSPLIANAQITATWRATSTTQGTIFPNKINNTEQSVMATFFTASSTTGTSTFAGLVGVGTTSPFTSFGVNGKSHFKGSNNDDFIIETGNVQHAASIYRTGGTGVHLGFNDVTSGFSTADGFDVGLNTSGEAQILNRENSAIRFYTNTNEKAVISAAGNFGLGTTSPYAKLSVVGEAVVSNITATSTTATSTFASRACGGTSHIGCIGDTGPGGLWAGNFTSGSIITRLASVGNGIGLTTGAGGQYVNLFDQDSGLMVAINDGTTQFNVAGNGYGLYAAGGPKYVFLNGNVGIGTTSPYKMLSVAGEVLANNFTATSTTATSTFSGGIIGPSALLTVQSSTGNVGIGTTSPSSRLTVSDTSSVVDLIRVVGKSSGGNETYFPLNIYNSVMQPLISFGGSSSEGATDDYGYISMKGQPTSAGGITGDFNVSNTAATGSSDKRLMTLRTIRGNDELQGSVSLVLRDSPTTFISNVFSATYLGGFGTNIAEPVASLHANATSTGSIVSMFQAASGQTNDLTRWVDSNQSTLSVVTSNGSLGIGTSSPPSMFSVQGPSSGSATKGTCFRAKDVGAGTFTYWWYKAGVQTVQTASCSGAGTTTVTYD